MVSRNSSVSVILPARNEGAVIGSVIARLGVALPDAEVIVVDDGSTDDTVRVAAAEGARVISHAYGMGNGAAVKTGSRAATGRILVFMDADGQHDPSHIPAMLETLEQGFRMVVGSRHRGSQASVGRSVANGLYNRLASYMTGHRIDDLTSGFRVVYAEAFREFLHLLPNGFSYPTTITMAFFRAGYSVAYLPVTVAARTGRSHIRPLRDGLRFLLIIFRVGTLYSPLKLFVPVSFLFALVGLGYYVYTFIAFHSFTNMSALLMTTAVVVFLIGLVSEQITNLTYAATRADRDH